MTKVETMGRSVEEWVGATNDAQIPARVKLRIWERCGGLCGLTGKKLRPGDGYDFDHIIALEDGGRHAESNLHVVWRPAHRKKTAAEAGGRAERRRKQKKHLGFDKPKGRSLSPPPGYRFDWSKRRYVRKDD